MTFQLYYLLSGQITTLVSNGVGRIYNRFYLRVQSNTNIDAVHTFIYNCHLTTIVEKPNGAQHHATCLAYPKSPGFLLLLLHSRRLGYLVNTFKPFPQHLFSFFPANFPDLLTSHAFTSTFKSILRCETFETNLSERIHDIFVSNLTRTNIQ